MDSRVTHFVNILFLLILMSGTAIGQTFKWGSALPEEEGLSTKKLYAMRDSLAMHKTTSILVIRNDKIVLEWYAEGWHPGKQHGTASLAKALVGGMSLALAINDGKIRPNDLACKFIPQWKNDPLKSKIRICELATHTSGIEDAELSDKEIADAKAKGIVYKDMHMDIPGWKSKFWRKDPDPFTIARDQAPVIFTPGTANAYSNPGMAMLAYAITTSYKGTPYKNIRTLLHERVYKPIGIDDDEWKIGYGNTYLVDGLELVANWGGGSFLPRGVARIGRLMLHRGNWEGKQLIKSSSVDAVIGYAGKPIPPKVEEKGYIPTLGLAWYNNYDARWPKAPRDLFYGAGAGNQTLLVFPGMNMIVVRNGQDMYDANKGEDFWSGVVKYLLDPLMDAYKRSSK